MMVIDCPCCGEKYYSENDFIENQRFVCEKCNKKFVFFDNHFVPYIVENLITATEYIGRCPFCGQKYSFDANYRGIIFCRACNNDFYVGEQSEIHINPVAEDTLIITGGEPTFKIDEVPASPEVEDIVEPVRIEPAPVEFAAVESESSSNDTPLVNFDTEDIADDSRLDISEFVNIKIGQKRSRAGVSGFFIGIAERLCRN